MIQILLSFWLFLLFGVPAICLAVMFFASIIFYFGKTMEWIGKQINKGLNFTGKYLRKNVIYIFNRLAHIKH